MIYPKIDRIKTIDNVQKKLILLRELFRINAYQMIRTIPIHEVENSKLEHEYKVVFSTPYDDFVYKMLKGISVLEFPYKFVLYNCYVNDISLYEMKVGDCTEVPLVSNAYKQHNKALLKLDYCVEELIIYKSQEEK